MFKDTDLNDKKLAVTGGMGYPLLPGSYVLEVTETRGSQTRKGKSTFEVMFKVQKSTNPAQAVGSTANFFVSLEQDWGPKDCKMIICVMLGLDPKAAKDADAIAAEDLNAVGELAVTSNVFKGRLVDCEVVERKNKEGRLVVYKNFSVNPATRESAQKALKK